MAEPKQIIDGHPHNLNIMADSNVYGCTYSVQSRCNWIQLALLLPVNQTHNGIDNQGQLPEQHVNK